MIDIQPMRETAARLLAALHGGEYARAGQLVLSYRGELEQTLARLQDDPGQAAGILAEARQALEAARQLTMLSRAEDMRRLEHLSGVRAYGRCD